MSEQRVIFIDAAYDAIDREHQNEAKYGLIYACGRPHADIEIDSETAVNVGVQNVGGGIKQPIFADELVEQLKLPLENSA